MRVLVVTVVHDPEDARIRHRQIPALLGAGHSVAYAAPFSATGRDVPPGVRGIDLPRAVGRRRIGALLAARRALRTHGPGADVVLLHDPDLLAALPGLLRGPLARTAVVWDVHEDTGAAVGMRSWIPGPLRRLARLAVHRAERWAEDHLELLLAEHGYATRFRRPHPVIPNSVRVPADEPPPPGTQRVVYLGRLTRARGAEDLVALGHRLRESGVDVTLDLIGDTDGATDALLGEARDAGVLHWRGFVPNDAAHALLDGAMAGISLLHDEPNYAHSRPTKLMEYMAHGLPVISTPNAASRELVERTGAGIVVPFGDVDAAARAVTDLHVDAGLRERLARAGRAAAVAEFDWTRDAERFVAALEGWGRAR